MKLTKHLAGLLAVTLVVTSCMPVLAAEEEAQAPAEIEVQEAVEEEREEAPAEAAEEAGEEKAEEKAVEEPAEEEVYEEPAEDAESSADPMMEGEEAPAEQTAAIVGIRAEIDEDTVCYTDTYTLINDHGDISFRDGYSVFLLFDDGTEAPIDAGEVNVSPEMVPSVEGPFDIEFSYTDTEGNVFTDVVTKNAVYPEALVDQYALSDALKRLGTINGKAADKLVFTDVPVPENAVYIREVGEPTKNAVILFRAEGEEDVACVTSKRPGVKVILPENVGNVINVGSAIREVDCRKLDTSRCQQINLFYADHGNFQSLAKKINFSGCDFSKVKVLNSAYNSYKSLESVDFSGCDFSGVEAMNYMFTNTQKLKDVDFSGAVFTPGKVTDMSYMFWMSGIEHVDLGDVDISGVTNTEGMFCKAGSLIDVDLSGVDLSKVEAARYMFQECSNLETINFHPAGMPSLKGSLRQMFDECRKLRNVDMSKINLGKEITNVFRVLYNCRALRTTLNIDASNYDTTSGYTFANMAIDDDAEVIINCTQASKDILTKDNRMIWATDATNSQHVIFNIIPINTWAESENGRWYADENSDPLTGLHKIDGKWYMFDDNGILWQEGWHDYNGGRAYVTRIGFLAIGWRNIDGERYYFESNMTVLTGPHYIGGKYYGLGEEGALVKDGILDAFGKRYITDADGVCRTGWVSLSDGSTYFLHKSKRYALTGPNNVDGKKYLFDENGVLCKDGRFEVNGRYYLVNADGVICSGWETIDGVTRYIDPETAVMAKGPTKIDGLVYLFSADGQLMKNGWKNLNGKWYLVDWRGVCRVGWNVINSKTFYFNELGARQTGLVEVDGVTYVFNTSGVLVRDGSVTIRGKVYHSDSEGRLIP